MPLIRRIPKRGFKSINRVEYQVVNVRDLERIDGDVDLESLKDAGLIRSTRKPVKILGVGEVAKALTVSAHAFSGSARSKIEGAGGSVVVIGAAAAASEAAAVPVEEPAAVEAQQESEAVEAQQENDEACASQ